MLFHILVLLSLVASAAMAQPQELTTAAAVRSLTVEQASLKTRVHLRGVVTFYDSSFYSRFIQDETSGIYLYDSGLPIRLVPGDLVEVEGTTSPGEYAPIVVPESIKVVGTAPLPEPKRVTYDLLFSGKNDSQFVEIVGTVRSVQVQVHENIKYHQIEVATGGGRSRFSPATCRLNAPKNCWTAPCACAASARRSSIISANSLPSA